MKLREGGREEKKKAQRGNVMKMNEKGERIRQTIIEEGDVLESLMDAEIMKAGRDGKVRIGERGTHMSIIKRKKTLRTV